MAIKKQQMQIATTIAATLRSLAFAGLAGGMIALAAAPAARAQSAEIALANTTQPAEISREYLIKAAILYNFAKFASWPETVFSHPGAPLRICVLGDDPFGAALETLHGKQVRGRPLATARIADVHDTPQCHILFVSASEEARLAQILDYVGQMPILSVADIGRFADSGGIIALKEIDNRSRIEVNLAAAKQAGLKLSSKLLRLADKAATPNKTGDSGGGLDADVPANAKAAL
ncbi:MAG: YfiR family protein [Alphaproteobacteria bacterium]|nr:YfiR family protein [Alphaproteobacteria bacterium]